MQQMHFLLLSRRRGPRATMLLSALPGPRQQHNGIRDAMLLVAASFRPQPSSPAPPAASRLFISSRLSARFSAGRARRSPASAAGLASFPAPCCASPWCPPPSPSATPAAASPSGFSAGASSGGFSGTPGLKRSRASSSYRREKTCFQKSGV